MAEKPTTKIDANAEQAKVDDLLAEESGNINVTENMEKELDVIGKVIANVTATHKEKHTKNTTKAFEVHDGICDDELYKDKPANLNGEVDNSSLSELFLEIVERSDN